jgi:hypothetical protein
VQNFSERAGRQKEKKGASSSGIICQMKDETPFCEKQQ